MVNSFSGRSAAGIRAVGRVAAACLLSIVVLACERLGKGTARTPDSSAAYEGWVAACRDSAEQRALSCAQGSVRRTGDTLRVHVDTGDVLFVTSRGEVPTSSQYAGRLGGGRFDVVSFWAHEANPASVFVNRRTGQLTWVPYPIVISPDGRRFATAHDDWYNCQEITQPELVVWQMTDSVPVREWAVVGYDCKARSGWGPTKPRWIGPDTLEFVRNDMDLRDTSKGFIDPRFTQFSQRAVLERNIWRVIGK